MTNPITPDTELAEILDRLDRWYAGFDGDNDDYLDPQEAIDKLTAWRDRAVAEARVDELERLLRRGHIAERASVPNSSPIAEWDRADWVSIQAPIFYTYASHIPGRISQLTDGGQEND